MSNGAGSWFAVSRMIFDHYLVGIHNRPYTDTEAWLWLISRAEFEPSEVVNKGRTIVLDPGQLMAAHSFLAKTWMWSEDKVRWFLKRLQTEAMITRACNKIRNTNQIQIITICNYTNYQHLNDDQHQAKSHQATHQAEHQAARQADKYIKPYDHRENSPTETISHQPTRTPSPQPLHQESNTIDTSKSTSFELGLEMQPDAGEKLPVKEAIAAYNSLVSRAQGEVPAIRVMTKARTVALRARLREHGIDGFMALIANIEASQFLRGHNDRGFNPNLDWYLKTANFVKVLEGAYNPKRVNGASHALFDEAYYERVRRDRLEREAKEAADAAARR